MRTFLAITAVCLVAATAQASSLASRPDLELTSTGHATLTLHLSSSSTQPTEVVRTIELPVGMTATGLSIAMGGQTLHAVAQTSSRARAEYDGIVAWIKDPALLSYAGDGRVVLRVFPVRRGAPATVTIELTATSLVEANKLKHVEPRRSLLAAPGEREEPEPIDQRYVDYWPKHHSAVPEPSGRI